MKNHLERLDVLGAKVFISHHRQVICPVSGKPKLVTRQESIKQGYVVLPNGGLTRAEVVYETGVDGSGVVRSIRYNAVAKCLANENFEYKVGTAVALGRVIEMIEFDHQPKIVFPARNQLWLVAEEASKYTKCNIRFKDAADPTYGVNGVVAPMDLAEVATLADTKGKTFVAFPLTQFQNRVRYYNWKFMPVLPPSGDWKPGEFGEIPGPGAPSTVAGSF